MAGTVAAVHMRGNKLDWVDHMAGTKAAIHRRGCHIVEAGGLGMVVVILLVMVLLGKL